MAEVIKKNGSSSKSHNVRRKTMKKKFSKKREPKWKQTVKEIENASSLYEAINPERVSKFSDLPLSSATRDGLRKCGYIEPTDIQKTAIPVILKGRDVLGAAKTGSGKTLAFLIPLLELLWRERWSGMDGMGALVVSPTRELAYQTFEVLRKVGCCHDFSAGLVMGGKDIEMEKGRIQSSNIVVCTPGRLLQHMDETADFDCSSLKLLILDEADRILDLGFQKTMNAILDNLPSERQTLLFSATQTKFVRDLARLSLVDPEYIAVHEDSKYSTPHKLVQSYLTCELQDKLSMLYSFIRSHVTSKIIVFISSSKQVKFVYESFRRMRPGVPLMALYGRQKHLKRMGIYNDFCSKKASVLICTDIAARGLDIPAVDWVLQLDCPEDASTYIHRVGRTARYEKDGKGLLFLLPSEAPGMLVQLKARKIPIEEIKVNPKKIVSIEKKLAVFNAQEQDMKQWAQRSFICYIRSVHMQSNKTIFDVHKLPLQEYASSLGLSRAPRVRFMQKLGKRSFPAEEMEGGGEAGSMSDDEVEGDSGDDEEEEDLLFVKRVIQPSKDDSAEDDEQELEFPRPPKHPRPSTTLSKISTVKKILNKKIKLNTHVKFNEEEEEGEDSGEESSGTSDTSSEEERVSDDPELTLGAKRKRGGRSSGRALGGTERNKKQLGTNVEAGLRDDEELARHLLCI